ncbi:MAG: hypothetical protein HOV81_11225 [Kofleriaceae bacterium]|nr:hypothetical protein [Kofleriaceae bacterium]
MGSDDRFKSDLVARPPQTVERSEEPPVVARLVVEIRSDGSRTIARGAIDDAQHGERVAIEARGDSPMQLAIALARALTQLPRLSARSAVRGLLGRRRDK